MSFVLRIFFSGLIAFVPSQDKKELTVLLLTAADQHHMAGSMALPEHKPLLLVRAAGCDHDCPRIDAAVAKFLFPTAPSVSAAVDTLAHAVDRGAVWQLAGSDLSFNIPSSGVTLVKASSADGKPIPDTVGERADFDWVANLETIDPTVGSVDPAVFSDHPPGLIVARLKLTSGQVWTRSVIQVNGKVMPIDFRPLAGQARHPYIRAAAVWVQAEITVPGNSLEITEKTFAGKEKRTMSLKPINNAIDVAVLNISPPVFDPRPIPEPGVHFVRFWDLAKTPPPAAQRPIPQVPRARVEQRDWEALHGDQPQRTSALLRAIFPNARSTYDQILCPMGQIWP